MPSARADGLRLQVALLTRLVGAARDDTRLQHDAQRDTLVHLGERLDHLTTRLGEALAPDAVIEEIARVFQAEVQKPDSLFSRLLIHAQLKALAAGLGPPWYGASEKQRACKTITQRRARPNTIA